jgi:hypothetical protein
LPFDRQGLSSVRSEDVDITLDILDQVTQEMKEEPSGIDFDELSEVLYEDRAPVLKVSKPP